MLTAYRQITHSAVFFAVVQEDLLLYWLHTTAAASARIAVVSNLTQ